MADIFLSYAREDQPRVLPLVSALEQHGWSVFWDREIPAGKTWRDHIGQALLDAKCIMVAWSKTSVASQWVTEEAEEARKRGLLVPILLDDVEPPLGFRSIQAADLTNWRADRSSSKFDRLLVDLEGLLGPSSQATSSPARRPPVRWSRRRIAYAAGAVLLILAAYLGYSLWPESRPAVSKPTIRSFKARPTNITAGQRAQLEWQVSNATSVKIDPGLGSVDKTGTTIVTPAQTITYKLTATNAVGEAQSVAHIEVTESFVEDCLSFDPANLRLVSTRLVSSGERKWMIADGAKRLMFFDVKAEGEKALRIIEHYGMNRHCFVGRPDPSMEYFLVDGQAPSGQFASEDCLTFNPNGLEIRGESNGWLLTDGTSRMLIFGNKEEAEQALAILRRYRFTCTCYVGRPQPSMTYFRN